jgi:hypothetical protein
LDKAIMRKRNLAMATISIILLMAQMAMMAGTVVYGYSLVDSLLLGTISSVVLIALLAIPLPIDIFVIITPLLLLVEVSRATRTRGRHWWSRSSSTGELDVQE